MPTHRPDVIGNRVSLEQLAISSLFFTSGAQFASWFSRIPSVATSLDLRNASLGMVLLGAPLAGVVGAPFSGWLLSRFSARGVGVGASCMSSTALFLICFARTPGQLFAALSFLGVVNASVLAGINALAIGLEKKRERPVLSSFHAAFSIGAVAGGALGGLLVGHGISSMAHFGGIAIAGIALQVIAYQALPESHSDGVPRRTFVIPDRRMGALALIALCMALTEGAIGDWSGVYLVQALRATPSLAGECYAGYAFMQVVGRLLGASLIARWLSAVVLRGGCVVAAAGMAIALLTRSPLCSVLGFAVVGIGFANVFPIVYSAAGRSKAVPSATALPILGTAVNGGLLLGPPLFGFLAEALTLRGALGLVVALCLFVAAMAREAS